MKRTKAGAAHGRVAPADWWVGFAGPMTEREACYFASLAGGGFVYRCGVDGERIRGAGYFVTPEFSR